MTMAEYYILAFGRGKDGQLNHAIWKHDASQASLKATFKRLSGSAPEKGFSLMSSKGKQTMLSAKGLNRN